MRPTLSAITVLLLLSAAGAVPPGLAQETDRSDPSRGDPRPRLSWFPIVYYTPETSFAAGAGIILTRRDEDRSASRPDSLQLYLVYTAKNQAFVRVNPELYFAGDRGRLDLAASYIDMPTSFFGVGNPPGLDRDDVDLLEEEYANERFVFDASLLYRVVGALRAGATYRFASSRPYDLDPDGRLAAGDVFGAGGGDVSGAGLALEWDTRDEVFSPTRGGWYQASTRFHRDALGSDYDFEHYELDLRHYVPLGSGHVLALQAAIESTRGNVPFFELPTPPLRGLYQEVFLDRHMAAVQGEWRLPLRGRWGASVFAGVADVSDELSGLRPGDLYAGGAGVRYTLDREEGIVVRLDVGVSPWGVFPYLMIMQAF